MSYTDRQDGSRKGWLEDVLLIGAGGVGQEIARQIVMQHWCESLVIIDPDQLEESNLGRWPVGPDEIGKNKAEVLADFLRELRPNFPVIGINDRIEAGDGPKFDLEFKRIFFAAEGQQANEAAEDIFEADIEYDRLINASANAGHISVKHETSNLLGEQLGTNDGGYTEVCYRDVMLSATLSIEKAFKREGDIEIDVSTLVDLAREKEKTNKNLRLLDSLVSEFHNASDRENMRVDWESVQESIDNIGCEDQHVFDNNRVRLRITDIVDAVLRLNRRLPNEGSVKNDSDDGEPNEYSAPYNEENPCAAEPEPVAEAEPEQELEQETNGSLSLNDLREAN